MASRVKLIHGLLAPLRPTTTYVHGFGSLTRFHGPLCSKEHVELIPSVLPIDRHPFRRAKRMRISRARKVLILGYAGTMIVKLHWVNYDGAQPRNASPCP